MKSWRQSTRRVKQITSGIILDPTLCLRLESHPPVLTGKDSWSQMPWESTMHSQAPSEHALWTQVLRCFLCGSHKAIPWLCLYLSGSAASSSWDYGSRLMGLTLAISASQALILLPAWPYLQETLELPLHQPPQLPPSSASNCCRHWFQLRHGAGVGLPCSQGWCSQR